MNRDLELEQARSRAHETRRALRETMDDLHDKLDQQTERVEARVESARALAVRSNQVIHARPWLFVAGSLVVGIILGVTVRRRVRPLMLTANDGRVVEVVPSRPKGSVLGFLGGLIGKALVKGVISVLEKHHGVQSLIDRGERSRPSGAARDDSRS